MKNDCERMIWHIAHGDAVGAHATAVEVLRSGTGSVRFQAKLSSLLWEEVELPLYVEAVQRGRPPLNPRLAPWIFPYIAVWFSPEKRLEALRRAVASRHAHAVHEIIKREATWSPAFQHAVCDLFDATSGIRLRFVSRTTEGKRRRQRRNNLIRAAGDKRSLNNVASSGYIADDTARKIATRERQEVADIEAELIALFGEDNRKAK
jgi:hypothetical protein